MSHEIESQRDAFATHGRFHRIEDTEPTTAACHRHRTSCAQTKPLLLCFARCILGAKERFSVSLQQSFTFASPR